MGKVTFSGVVSAQASVGETVTIKVTKPDGTVDALIAQTDTAGKFSVDKNYPAGDYSATFHIDKDAEYAGADDGPKKFTVNLTPRTITGNVVVA